MVRGFSWFGLTRRPIKEGNKEYDFMTQWRLKGTVSIFLAVILLGGCASMGVSPEDKKRANASRNLAEAYLGEGNTSLAMRELLKAQKLNPEDAIVYNDFGLVYMDKENYELAAQSFEKAIALKPDYALAKNNLGSVYLALNQWDKAIPILKEVTGDILYATPHYPLANLGWAYYNKGDYKAAETYLHKALELEPNFSIAQIHLGRTYLATGRLHQARELFENVAKSNPKNPTLLYEMGKTYRLLGDYNNAILALKGCIEYAENSDLAVKAAEELKKIYQ
jgi:type IV pilus assembly protein PilF